MKICRICNKNRKYFAKTQKRKLKNGEIRQDIICRNCHRDRNKFYYDKYKKEGKLAYYLIQNRTKNRTSEIRDICIKKLGGKCKICGIEDFDVLEIDHINPVFKSKEKRLVGPFFYRAIYKDEITFENLQILCANCHTKKTRLDRQVALNDDIIKYSSRTKFKNRKSDLLFNSNI